MESTMSRAASVALHTTNQAMEVVEQSDFTALLRKNGVTSTIRGREKQPLPEQYRHIFLQMSKLGVGGGIVVSKVDDFKRMKIAVSASANRAKANIPKEWGFNIVQATNGSVIIGRRK